MKLGRIQAAAAAVLKLMEKEMGYGDAHRLVMLKNKLQPHAVFFVEKEMALAERYGEKGEDGKVAVGVGGTFRFADEAAAVAYRKERLALCEVEVEGIGEPVRIAAPDRVSPATVEALIGFVEFEEKEG